VLLTPRLVRALEPDVGPPLPTLPRRVLPAPGPGGVEMGAPGNPDREKTGGGAPQASTMVDAPPVANEKTRGKPGSR
jgi:hypothetical protein